MRSLLLITVFAFVTVSALSQVQLTKADYTRFFNATSVETYTAYGIENTRFYVGSPGGQNQYDFNGVTFQKDEGECSYVNPAATPFVNRFPNSTHGLCHKRPDGSDISFFNLKDEALYFDGDGRITDGIMFVYSTGVNRPIVKFPAQVGTSWDYEGEKQNFGLGSTTQSITHYTFDANGDLVLGFDQQPCVRLKTVDELITESMFNGQLERSVRRTISYTFITDQGMIFTAGIDTLDDNLENPRMLWMRFTKHNLGPVGVSETPEVAGLSLSQNYPNPVSAVGGYLSTVSWNLTSAASIRLALFDIAGREKLLLKEGYSEAGNQTLTFDAGSLPPGTYLLRLTAGSKSQVRTLTVEK